MEEARSGVILDVKGKEVEEDPKLGRMLRYRALCQGLVKMASDYSSSEKETAIVWRHMGEMNKEIMALRSGEMHETNEKEMCDPMLSSSIGMLQPTGIKKRLGLKRRRRMKSWVENQRPKRKVSRSMSQPNVTHSQSEQYLDIGASSQVQFDN